MCGVARLEIVLREMKVVQKAFWRAGAPGGCIPSHPHPCWKVRAWILAGWRGVSGECHPGFAVDLARLYAPSVHPAAVSWNGSTA